MYAKFGEWKEKFRDNIVDLGGKLTGDNFFRVATRASLLR